MSIKIAGLGAMIPPAVRTNDAWPESFLRQFNDRRKRDITTIEYSESGAKNNLDPHMVAAMAPYIDDPFRGTRRRHVVSEGVSASDLECRAALDAIKDAGLLPGQIDVALVASAMPDMMAPLNGPVLQHKAGLSNAMCYSTDEACASFVGHLLLANALISSGMARYVLSVTSCTMSSFIDFDSPMGVPFGDGAAACVFSAANEGAGLLGFSARTEGQMHRGIVVAHVSDDGHVASRYQDVLGRVVLTTNDPAVGKMGGIRGLEWCRGSCFEALDRARVALSEVDLYFGAQSLKWFPDACRRALGLRPEQVVETYDEVANIAPATIPYNLFWAREQGRLLPGSTLLLYAPGVGMHRIAAVLKMPM